MTREKLISKANDIYGVDRYDFTLVPKEFNVKDKITIICHEKHIYGEEHGAFETSYDNFINKKHGCGFCSKRWMNTDVFIKTSQYIHKNKYIYTSTVYKDKKTKVKIICPKHGIFETLPFNHFKYDCQECGKEKLSSKTSNTLAKFREDVKNIHSNEYEYDWGTYVNYKTPMRIFHKKCQKWFTQSPSKHIHSGHGCTFCKMSKGQKTIIEFLNNHNILNESEKTFPFLKNGKGVQKLDIFIPTQNIAIEFQGIQHFKEVDIFPNLDKTIERDVQKYNLCLKNNIVILYFVDSLSDVDWSVPIYNKENTFELKDINIVLDDVISKNKEILLKEIIKQK